MTSNFIDNFGKIDGLQDPSKCIQRLRDRVRFLGRSLVRKNIKEAWRNHVYDDANINFRKNIAYTSGSQIFKDKFYLMLFETSKEVNTRHLIMAGLVVAHSKNKADVEVDVLLQNLDKIGSYEEEHRQIILNKFVNRAKEYLNVWRRENED